jgi:hypothetical protein
MRLVFVTLAGLLTFGLAAAECNGEICYGLSADELAAFVPPTFEQPFVDTAMLHDRNYWRIDGALPIYDAPNGNVTRTLDNGFNFVTSAATQDGWTEINPGEWVASDQLKNANWLISEFSGIILPEQPLEYPVAWMLINAYASSEPGGPALESNDLKYRYTRVNIFDTVEVDGWNWYQIGPDEWVEQTGVAKMLPVARPAGVDTERWVSIDLYEQVMIAYEGDKPVFSTLISSGLPRWPTYEGIFNIYYRKTREQMSWGTPGDDFYYLEEVPWTMYFDEGRALHGAYWHNGFGYRRSHGCVNMTITDAHWLYQWVAQDFDTLNSPDVETGPAVYVYSSGEYR